MPTLHVRLLGHFQLIYDDTPVTTIKGARLQALVAYLLLNRDRALLRQRVAATLWPESETRQARSNLRNKLDAMRKKFPAFEDFLHDDERLQWRADMVFTLDVAEFEQALQRVEQAKRHHDPVATLAALKEAVALYTDDLLVKLHDDWVLAARQRLRNQFFSALEALITLLKGQHDYNVAVHYAHRLIRDNPLSEAAYRQLIELYFLNEDYTSALRAYETCKAILQSKLKVAPSIATEELCQRVITSLTHAHVSASGSLASRGGVASPLSPSSAQELRRLAAAWLADSHRQTFTGVTCFLAQLATLLAANGEITEALRIIERAFVILTMTGETFWEAELHRLHGKLLWQQNKPVAEIEACFHKAIAVARRQNAKFQELCAVANLCVLWQHTNKYAMAQQQLADLYDIFRDHATADGLPAVLALFNGFL